MSKKVIVVGAGFTGMSVAAYLALNGFEVEIYEKNEQIGGRAKHFTSEGFTFDMGPSWYCFPEIIENFFTDFGKKSVDFFSLQPIDPLGKFYFSEKNFLEIPLNHDSQNQQFESLEKEGKTSLTDYLAQAKTYYDLFLHEIVKPDFKGKPELKFRKIVKNFWQNIQSKPLQKFFRNPKTIVLLKSLPVYAGVVQVNDPFMEHAVIYSVLNYGPNYPKGGIFRLVEALEQLLQELKVPIYYGSGVESFDIIDDRVTGIITHGKTFHADIFVSATDYYHTEQLIPRNFRNYSEKKWKIRTKIRPVLIYFLGFDKKLLTINPITTMIRGFNSDHRNKKFNFRNIYDSIFIISPSKLDNSKAPEGKESLIIRINIPGEVEDTGKMREHYFEQILQYIENITGEELLKHIIYKRSYARSNFEEDYNIFKGVSMGWLNTLYQLGKPNLKIRNRHLQNLFYGEYPFWLGAGIPATLVSGKIIANEIINAYNKID